MKRICLILSLLLVPLLLCHCRWNAEKIDYLAPFHTPFRARGCATVDGSIFEVELVKDSAGILIQTTSVGGFSLSFGSQNGTILMEADGETVAIPKSASRGIPLLFSLFTLSRADLTNVEKDKAGNVDLTIVSFSGSDMQITLTLLSKNNIPTKIEGVVRAVPVSLVFDTFTPER